MHYGIRSISVLNHLQQTWPQWKCLHDSSIGKWGTMIIKWRKIENKLIITITIIQKIK